MSMTAEDEYEQRTEQERSHAELIFLLLLAQSRDIAEQIRTTGQWVIDSAPIRQALLNAGYAGAKIIADNAITPKEIVDFIKGSGYIEDAADLAASQMALTSGKRVHDALIDLLDRTRASDALTAQAALDSIAHDRAELAAGNMVVDGAEGLKDRLVNNGTKTWLNVGDRRVRHTHMKAGGQTVPANGFFSVGGAMMRHPRDPAGPAKETMRCRCVARYSQEW